MRPPTSPPVKANEGLFVENVYKEFRDATFKDVADMYKHVGRLRAERAVWERSAKLWSGICAVLSLMLAAMLLALWFRWV